MLGGERKGRVVVDIRALNTILNGEVIDLASDDWDEPLPPTGIDIQSVKDEITASEAIGVSTSELIGVLWLHQMLIGFEQVNQSLITKMSSY